MTFSEVIRNLPDKARRKLTDDEKQIFASEIALGYFEPEELRKIFKLLPEGFNYLMAGVEMQNLISIKRREIDGSPDALRIHARRAARLAIDQLGKIVCDAEAPAKTRMAAGKELRDYAMVADKEALEGGSNEAVIIKTNLDLKDARGVYQVTAAEIDAMQEDDEPEWFDLLGIEDD